MALRLFEFTMWLADDPRELDDWSHALFEAGADDCTPGIDCGRLCASFHRDADSLEEAIRTAHRQLQDAGLRVLRCEIGAEELAT